MSDQVPSSNAVPVSARRRCGTARCRPRRRAPAACRTGRTPAARSTFGLTAQGERRAHPGHDATEQRQQVHERERHQVVQRIAEVGVEEVAGQRRLHLGDPGDERRADQTRRRCSCRAAHRQTAMGGGGHGVGEEAEHRDGEDDGGGLGERRTRSTRRCRVAAEVAGRGCSGGRRRADQRAAPAPAARAAAPTTAPAPTR